MQGKRGAQHRAMAELERLQAEMEERWFNHSLPEDWQGLFADMEIDKAKTRVTLRLDTDMVRWFRKTGPGYGQLINRILRVYWTSLMAGHIKAYYKHDTTTQIFLSSHYLMKQQKSGR